MLNVPTPVSVCKFVFYRSRCLSLMCGPHSIPGIMYVNKYVNLEGVNNRHQRLMCCKAEGPHDGDDWDRERRRRRRVLVLQNEWWLRKGGARPVLAVRSGH